MRRLLKWAGLGLGGLLGLVVLAAAAIYLVSNNRLDETYAIALSPVEARSDSGAVARGAHLAVIRGCADCHGDGLGGQPFIEDPAIGRLYASNLTSGVGGVGATYTDEDWDRAVRHGVGPDGRGLLFMPSQEFHGVSDDDLADLIAYIRSVPPVDNVLPANAVGPVGRVLYLTGNFPLVPAELIDHERPRAPTPPAGPTAEYGAYLAATCTGCHGRNFAGGAIPGMPPGTPTPTNLTPDEATGLGAWTEADFVRALREGVRPDGSAIDPFMPVRMTKHMTDEEIIAIWRYLQTLEPVAMVGA